MTPFSSDSHETLVFNVEAGITDVLRVCSKTWNRCRCHSRRLQPCDPTEVERSFVWAAACATQGHEAQSLLQT